MNEIIKVWVTKYAITEGVFEIEAEWDAGIPSLVTDRSTEFHAYYHVEGRDWHRTREGAHKRAEAMRAAKLQSLRRSIAKLEAMSFTQ